MPAWFCGDFSTFGTFNQYAMRFKTRYIVLLLVVVKLFSFQSIAQTNPDSLQVAGWINQFRTEHDTAWLGKAMDFAKSNAYDTGKGLVLIEYAIHYLGAAEYQKSLACLQTAFNLFEQTGNLHQLERVNSSLSQLYYFTQDFERAVLHGERALDIARQRKNKVNQAIHLGNLGSYYLALNNVDKSLATQNESLKLGYELNDTTTIFTALNNLGTIYFDKGDYQAAFDRYTNGYPLAIYLQDLHEICRLGTNLAETAIRLDRPHAALKYVIESENYCTEIPLNLLAYRTRVVAKARQMTGDHKTAAELFERHYLLTDSLFNEEKFKTINDLTNKYETEQKEQQIAMLETRAQLQQSRLSQLIALVVSVGLILVLLGTFAWQIQKQRKKSDYLLGNILPQSVISELKTKGNVQARQHEMVSILFTDFVRFTQFAAQLNPEQLVAQIDRCYRGFDEIIARHGCEKIKTIGDAYMAVCGLPNPVQDHALRLTRAAFEILDFMRQTNAQNQADNLPQLQIRIGLHSGPVVAGVVGLHKFAYDIWGDTVNIAARMEQNGVPDQVNVSALTRDLLAPHAQMTFRGEQEIKGKGKYPMYLVNQIDED